MQYSHLILRIAFLMASFFVVSPLFAVVPAEDSVLLFRSPLPFTVLTADLCTVTVEAKVPVLSVSLYADFYPTFEKKTQRVPLGTVSTPPYRVLWNLSHIPNQLYHGATISAEAVLLDGTIHASALTGVFVTRDSVVPERGDATAGKIIHFGRKPIELTSRYLLSSTTSARAQVQWDHKNLTVSVDVNDPHLILSPGRDSLEKLGIKIAIDPLSRRSPYLSRGIQIFSLPLTGEPERLLIQSGYRSNGSFGIRSQNITVGYLHAVTVESGKGYTAVLTIPLDSLFEGAVPREAACNITATVIDEDGSFRELSWSKEFLPLVPYNYNTLAFVHRTSQIIPFLIYFLLLCTGVFLGAFIMALLRRLRFPPHLVNPVDAPINHASPAALKAIEAAIHAGATDRNFSRTVAADRINLSPAAIQSVVKKHYGRSFEDQLTLTRVELAKERLRSSRAGEGTVAKICGFASLEEMERGFRRFAGTTPMKFREEFKVG